MEHNFNRRSKEEGAEVETVEIKEIYAQIPEYERGTCPVEVFSRHPTLIPEFDKDGKCLSEGEVIHLIDNSVFAVDLPNYSTLMKGPKAELSTKMFDSLKDKLAKIASQYDISLLAGAGDELLLSGDIGLLDSVMFSVEVEVARMETMEEYPNVENYLKEAGKDKARTHIAADYPSEKSDHLTLQMIPMGDPNLPDTRWDLTPAGEITGVKDLAVQEVTVTEKKIHETGLLGTPQLTLAVPTGINERQAKVYLNTEFIRQTGLAVDQRNEEDQIIYEIGFPKNASKQDLEEILLKLRESTGALIPKKLQFTKTSQQIAKKIIALSSKMATPYAKKGLESPAHAGKEQLNKDGTCAFFHVGGLGEIKTSIKENSDKIFTSEDKDENQQIMNLMARTKSYLVRQLGQETQKSDGLGKETEPSRDESHKLITLFNIYEESGTRVGDRLASVGSAMRKINTQEFQQGLLEYLGSEFKSEINTEELAKIITMSQLSGAVGVSHGAGYFINETKKQGFVGSDGVGGVEISMAARLTSLVSKEYYKNPEVVPDLDDYTIQKLDKIKGIGCMVLDRRIAEEEGFYDPRNPNHILLSSVQLKNVGEADVVVIATQDPSEDDSKKGLLSRLDD